MLRTSGCSWAALRSRRQGPLASTNTLSGPQRTGGIARDEILECFPSIQTGKPQFCRQLTASQNTVARRLSVILHCYCRDAARAEHLQAENERVWSAEFLRLGNAQSVVSTRPRRHERGALHDRAAHEKARLPWRRTGPADSDHVAWSPGETVIGFC